MSPGMTSRSSQRERSSPNKKVVLRSRSLASNPFNPMAPKLDTVNEQVPQRNRANPKPLSTEVLSNVLFVFWCVISLPHSHVRPSHYVMMRSIILPISTILDVVTRPFVQNVLFRSSGVNPLPRILFRSPPLALIACKTTLV